MKIFFQLVENMQKNNKKLNILILGLNFKENIFLYLLCVFLFHSWNVNAIKNITAYIRSYINNNKNENIIV